MIQIYKHEICNLSRIPTAIEDNPCYNTVLELMADASIGAKNTTLYRHYKNYNPKTLSDLFQVAHNKLNACSYKHIFLPWIHTGLKQKHTPKDVAFIKRSDKFIINQIDKLAKLMISIKKRGYAPKKYPDRRQGHIAGYYLESENEKKFYVVAGNHRVAVLSALFPNEPIPVIYDRFEFLKSRDKVGRDEPPRNIYSYKDVDDWPSVTSSFIDSGIALKILERYTNA